MYLRMLRICLIITLVAAFTVLISASPVKAVSRSTSPRHFFHPAGVGLTAAPQRVSTSIVPQSHGYTHGPSVTQRPGPASTHHTTVPRQGAVPVSLPKGLQPNTTTLVSFGGQTDTSFSVSDTTVAPGPVNVVETINEQWAVYDRSGHQQYLTTFDNWFGESIPVYQPQSITDPWSEHFIFMVTDGSQFLVSVSQDPHGSAVGPWCNYAIHSIVSLTADAPRLGVDLDHLYLTANLYYPNSQQFISSEIFRLDKNAMESCRSTTYSYWTNLLNPDGSKAFTIVPAVEQNTFDAASTEYLINSIPSGGSTMTLWSLTSQGLSNTSVNTQSYTPPPPAAQANSSGTLKILDNRLNQASLQANTLSTTLATGYDWGTGQEVAAVEWFQIDVIGGRVTQQGTFGRPGSWLFYPAIQQDQNGNLVVVYDISDPSMYPSIWYTGLTINGAFNGTSILVSGNGWYGSSGTAPWGEYQSAWIDPNDDTSVWIAGQYAAAFNAWGTWIGDVKA